MSKQPLDFKISTGLKNIIGRELITEEHTAIFELVKNSYDAGASKVSIVFHNVRGPEQKNQSKILIVDDGDGMSYSDLKNKWLFVGYSEKKIDEESDDYRDKIANRKRVFAGAKGIGRFSVDRLGSKLDLYTKTANDDNIHLLEMDWEKFEEDQKQTFQEIFVNYSTVNEIPIDYHSFEKFKKGTILEIFPLRDDWDRNRIVKLKRYLQRLVNPTQISSNQKFKIEIIAKEFLEEDNDEKIREKHKEVNGEIKNIVFEKLNIKTTQIKCKVTEKKIITEIIDKGEFIFKLEEENTFPLLKDISVYVFYLNKEAKTTFTTNMGLPPVQFGNIFLYRFGFRIHPYGEQGDDWLLLEPRKAQGTKRYLSTRDLIGRVEIHDFQPGFKEVSSRAAGVVRTKHYESLVDFFIEKVLRRLERYVVEGIDWDRPEEKKTKSEEEIKRDSLDIITKIVGQVKDPHKNITFNPELISIFKKREIENLPAVLENVETLLNYVKTSADKDYIEKQLKSLRSVAKVLTAGMKSAEQELKVKKREILFLKKNLADSEIVEDYHHTIRIATGYVENYLNEINTIIAKGGKIKDIIPMLDSISRENQKVISLVSLVSKANFNLQIKNIRKDVIEFIAQYLQTILRESYRRIRYSFTNQHLSFVTRFKPLEISMIFDNFVSNSRKANASLIKIKFEIKNKSLHILVGDNGKGISKNNVKYIFDRGFTTTDGSGIGLNHIKTTIEKMNGSIRFVGNDYDNLGKGACFEMILQ